MTLGPVRVMGAGVVVMMCVEKVRKFFVCMICKFHFHVCIVRNLCMFTINIHMFKYVTELQGS